MTFSFPGRVALGFPQTPAESVRTDGRWYGRTLTSEPNFLASIGYQICSATVLRWRPTRVGSAITLYISDVLLQYFTSVSPLNNQIYNKAIKAKFDPRLITCTPRDKIHVVCYTD